MAAPAPPANRNEEAHMPNSSTDPAPAASSAVHLAGSTTMLSRMRRVAEAYMGERPAARIVVIDGGGTARGCKALLDRTVDIAMASGGVPDEFANQLAGRRALRTTIISTDAIVPLVHAANPVADLSLRQLANIFSGRISNWKEAGGADAPIHVLVGPPGGGVTVSFKQLVLGDDATFTPSRVVLETGKRLQLAGGDPHAITYVAMMPLDRLGLKILTVDGLQPDVLASAYPLRAPMMLALAGAPSAAAGHFIAYAERQWNSAGAGERP